MLDWDFETRIVTTIVEVTIDFGMLPSLLDHLEVSVYHCQFSKYTSNCRCLHVV